MLFDTHTHVNFQPFKSDYKAVIQRAIDNDIVINNVGSQWESSQRSVAIANEFEKNVWASVGLHPIHIFEDIIEEQRIEGKVQKIKTRAEEFDYDAYKKLAQSSKKVVAIGECGLDYLHFDRTGIATDKRDELIQKQITILKQHIELAIELDLPVIIHCRDAAVHAEGDIRAFEDLLRLLRPYSGKVRGVIHCYTGLASYVPKFLDLGLYIGYTGIATFPNSTEVQAAVKATPLDRILLETDAPYLTPEPYRGKRNEPMYVEYVAQGIAKLKNVSYEELAKITTRNAFELFRVS